jgi:N-acetyl-alpha-D-muramate 1-phosphate uridylyltransferase
MARAWRLTIRYSEEGRRRWRPAAASSRRCPGSAAEPFLVVNGDVFTDFDFRALHIAPEALGAAGAGAQSSAPPAGDFALEHGRLREQGMPRWTYSGIGLYRPEFFAGCVPGRFPLLPLLRRAMAAGRLHGQLYMGRQLERCGHVERLAALQRRAR